MKIMAAFSPLAFAVAQASTHENGLLFIQTQNNGSDSRYHAELADVGGDILNRSEEHTSELQSLMRISYADFCLKKTNKTDSALKYTKLKKQYRDYKTDN